ncbi:MAG: peptidoglycan D,D-transpeptidase FtsI family protein, partial [Planctomycetota bacterium]
GNDSSFTDGYGIILTMDATIQQFAHEELMKQYKSYEAESAVAIVTEPKTGAILAMVSLPDFEPDDIGNTDPNNLRNRAITDQFEPGSIIKPLIVAMALDCGVINKDESIFCENGYYHGKGFGKITEYRNHQYGNLMIREIIIKSSNIGMAKIGQKLGRKKLYEGLKLFGFGEKTGIELPGEVDGLLWPTKKWTGYSVTRIPFGQEIAITTLQIVQAYSILANGGRYVRPFLVQAIIDNNGEIVKLKRPTPPVGFVIKPEVAKWVVRDAMVGVVNEKSNGGTGWRAKLDKWQVFGKTGTADIPKEDQRGYEEDATIASFIAGAPAEQPEILVLVSIRRPNKALGKGNSGGVVASPAAGKIIERTLNYLENKRL